MSMDLVPNKSKNQASGRNTSKIHVSNHSIMMNWLLVGCLATLSFGSYGLFSKLSAFEHPTVSNLVIYATATICGIVLLVVTGSGVIFSKESFLSGISSNIAALTMLYSLVSNQVLVVFSFVSFASVVFFLIVLGFEKPTLSGRQKWLACVGILVSVLGLFIASTSTVGGINYVLKSATFNPDFLVIAPLMPLGFGLWSYFSFVAIKKKGAKVPTVFFNYSFGSILVATTSYLVFAQGFPLPRFSELRDIFPVVAGFFVAVGVIFALQSFRMTSGESRIEETVVAILANAEIIPLMFLSYFILGEFTIEGFLGALMVFLGLSILNSARVS
ncbi:MAG: hypothetical protein ABSA92_01260 [Candidatus Bathyarchaeia archaeon]